MSDPTSTAAPPLPPIVAGDCIGAIIAVAAKSGIDAVDARILIGHALGLNRIQLITQSERQVSAAEVARLLALLGRRLAGEPVAYLIGTREFYGLAMQVSPDVLIPRPETELLVELALARLPLGGCLLDLGTGSGAIAAAIAHVRPDAAVTASDVSAAALAVAQSNVQRHARGRPVTLRQGNWYAALAGTITATPAASNTFHVVVSNPPYIAAGDPHLATGDLRFEPAGALTDGSDGLSALRAIIEGAPRHLDPSGWLLMEHGYDQAAAVRALLTAEGFADVQSWRDLAGIERVSGGRLAR